MIVFGSRLDRNNRSKSPIATGAAYDPVENSWRILPPVTLSPQASAITWTGDEMLAWDYELTAWAYDPADDQWVDIDDVPLEFSECYPQTATTGGHVLAYFCGATAVFDLETREWTRVASQKSYGTPVAADGVFMLAGAAHETIHNRFFVYRPR